MATKNDLIEALKKVMDPELMIDVWTLELIYKIDIKDDNVNILMTFTTPLCPYGEQLKEDIKNNLSDVEGVNKVNVEVTFEPRWQPSDDLRAVLGV